MKQTIAILSLCLLFSCPAPADENPPVPEFTQPQTQVAVETVPPAPVVAESYDAATPTIPAALPQAPADSGQLSSYLVAPGDALIISVWKEEGLQDQQYLVSPDGSIIFPLIGTINVAGKTTTQIRELLTARLSDFISEPSVTVKLLNNQGNTIFVIGKVVRPGQYFTARKIDVLQALSLAGGLTVYASDASISILRRIGNQTQVFPFDYSDVIKGEDLEQNILLEPGDTVAVP